MKKTFLFVGLAVAVSGCSRAHIRTYDLEPQALILIQDEHEGTRPIEIGERYLVMSDKEALVVVENVRSTRYPLLKGWSVERDDDSFTIEEIPTFKPY